MDAVTLAVLEPVPESPPAATPPRPAAANWLDAALPSGESRKEFLNRSVAASNTILTHAWALRRLAERYPSPRCDA